MTNFDIIFKELEKQLDPEMKQIIKESLEIKKFMEQYKKVEEVLEEIRRLEELGLIKKTLPYYRQPYSPLYHPSDLPLPYYEPDYDWIPTVQRDRQTNLI